MIPTIASFFSVSTDELFDFNLYEIEKNIQHIVSEYSKYYDIDKEKCEQILRDGLRKYPGNDVLINCLVGVISIPERSGEVIELCKALIESTRCDEVRIDAYRIMAEAYKSIGEYSLAKEVIENIPEIYFSKLSVAAKLLEDEDMLEAAVKHKSIALEDIIDMCELLASYYEKKGEKEYAVIQLQMAKKIIYAAEDDFATRYTKNLFVAFNDRLKKIEDKLFEYGVNVPGTI